MSNQPKTLAYPDRVTLKWLYHHVPWTLWVWMISLLISAFTLGLLTAESNLYRKFIHHAPLSNSTDVTRSKETDNTKKTTKRYQANFFDKNIISYEEYDLSQHPDLRNLIETINAERVEFPKRNLDIYLIQDYLDSGNLEMAEFASKRLREKQHNLRSIRKQTK